MAGLRTVAQRIRSLKNLEESEWEAGGWILLGQLLQSADRLGGFDLPERRRFHIEVMLNLVTTAAWPGHPEWIRSLLEVLGTKIEP